MAEESAIQVDQTVLDEVETLAARFASARPFRHVAIDNFFTADAARALAERFPAFDEELAMDENGRVGAKAVNENVRSLGGPWAVLDDLVQGEAFRGLISRITGVPNLQYDPHYFGGGTHENLHGQGLDAHVDFNFHPVTRQHRRLNLIIYLTEEWEDAWGGSIQLHKDPYLPPSQDEIAVVTPLFNRCVIFETNEYSWHGFPRINLPEEKRHLSRKSFALYYYTVSRPAEELGSEHSTIYVEQHLPETLAPGEALSGEEVQRIRDLVFTRDQHLKRLYGNIKQLNDELNDLKERFKLQAPPGVADEPAVEPGRDPSTGLPSPASVSESDDSDEQAEEHAVDRTLLDAQLQQRAQQIKLLEQQVHELKQSTSWRVTRPLRRLKTLLARQ